MSAPHTPGPWHVCPESQASHRWVIAQDDGSSVADCSPVGPWVSPKEADANAHVIASAPDGLAFAQAFVANIDEWDGEPSPGMRWHKEYIAAKALIAKATGERA